MTSQQFFHEITVTCEPGAVFDYVTNPQRWHEWFASSLPAEFDIDPQTPGQHFEVKTAQRPLKLLPLRLIHPLQCTISKSDRPYLWEVEAESSLVFAIISYTFSQAKGGTILKRQFSYTTKGWLRYTEPLLFRKRIASQARASLEKFKTNLEQDYY